MDSSVFYFEQGIPGFEHLHQFAFADLEVSPPMKLMQSVEDMEISLIVVSPFFIYPEYEWILSEAAKEELQIQSEQEVEIWTVLTVPVDPAAATINLMAPIVLNANKKTGKQVILHDSTYSSKSPINRI
ncbi:flagellar assembly protein FliW [Paenibacillus arenilitoris]|uniref:Flagellar assembly factor FliW n=1 Tax=Paenibacillus arenilitoris TaxID=2772299 RepID=A0A927H5D3_9BACL|nr:flagellar assembly protein FliW [Paenibacillus arenilitoris]MBD2868413.1 flagellar assembly protein FliW [Paenibacillus arenilitoris]